MGGGGFRADFALGWGVFFSDVWSIVGAAVMRGILTI